MMSSFAITPRRRAVSLGACYIQGHLFLVPLHGPSMVGASALRTQKTSGTHSGRSLVFNRAANGMHPPRLECLTRRTEVNVALCVVGKSFVAKDAPLARMVSFA